MQKKLADNLERFLEELNVYASEDEEYQDRQSSVDADCQQIAQRMFLSHATGNDAFGSGIRNGELWSFDQCVRRGVYDADGVDERAEIRLGTSDDVFTFAGPIRYPGTCGLLFSPSIEERLSPVAVATPFDSGGVVSYLRPDDEPQQQNAFVRRYELPVPGYRTALEACLTILFRSPWNYIDGTGPAVPGPIAVQGGDARRWTFEVRFEKHLPLEGHVVAVFLPVAVATREEIQQRLEVWQRSGVLCKFYNAADDVGLSRVIEESVEYFYDRLERS